jgi:hypothetical protein
MKPILTYFENTYFTDLASFLFAIFGLLVSIRITRHNNLIVFKFYFACYILIKLINYLTVALYSTQKFNQTIITEISDYTDYIFTIIEYCCFAWFLKNHVNKVVFKISSLIFFSSALILYTYQIATTNNLQYAYTSILFTIQAITLLMNCISYFVIIFKNVPDLALTNEPHFWVVTGLTFFMVSTLPFSVYSYYLSTILLANAFSIFFVFYSILFGMIIRGYLCKQIVTKS